MSYDESDAARDEFYETLRRELYDELRDEAVAEFSEERLRSFYMKNPDVMRPALEAMREGKCNRATNATRQQSCFMCPPSSCY